MLVKKVVTLSVFVFGINAMVSGQCCSMGNPLNSSSSSGVVAKNNLKVNVFYKFGRNETYFRQNIRLVNYGMFKSSGYSFSGLQLGYGLTKKLTIEHDMGYFVRKELEYYDPALNQLAENGSGLSNGILGLKYLVNEGQRSGIEIVAGTAVKYPFSTEIKSINGVELPIELQPSTRSWGWVAQLSAAKMFTSSGVIVVINHRYESNSPDPRNYTYGSMHTTTLNVSRSFFRKVSLSLAFRNEYKDGDKTPTTARLASEGGNLVLLSPRVNYEFARNYSISLFGDLPVYKYYFGEQISVKYAFGFGIVGNLNFNSKKISVEL